MTQHTHETELLLVAGVVPERIVKQLCNNRVNYYFAQINRSTEQMTDMFAGEYKHSQNAVFKVMEYTANLPATSTTVRIQGLTAVVLESKLQRILRQAE